MQRFSSNINDTFILLELETAALVKEIQLHIQEGSGCIHLFLTTRKPSTLRGRNKFFLSCHSSVDGDQFKVGVVALFTLRLVKTQDGRRLGAFSGRQLLVVKRTPIHKVNCLCSLLVLLNTSWLLPKPEPTKAKKLPLQVE